MDETNSSNNSNMEENYEYNSDINNDEISNDKKFKYMQKEMRKR